MVARSDKMQTFHFTSYDTSQLPAILALWNSSELRQKYPLDPALWRANTELEPNFRPEDFRAAWTAENQLAGFGLTRRFHETKDPLMAERIGNTGWISVILVGQNWRGQGLGASLLVWADEQLAGVNVIKLGSEVGNFFPGLPLELPRSFFENRGYSFNPESVHDLARSLHDWQLPPTPPAVQSGEYFYTQGHAGEQEAIVDFLRRPSTGFSLRWPFLLERWFGMGYAPTNVTLLKRASGEIAGFCQTWNFAQGWFEGCPRTVLYWARAELPTEIHGSLGPLGVDSTVRGGGLGLGLVAAATNYLQQEGATFATIDWTDLTDFYGKLGYKPWRNYLYAQKEIS